MKRLQMTPALSAMIKAAVGNDVDTDKLAVFESISLNSQPLRGKKGTIFEKAVPEPITLAEIVDRINSPGGHAPLMTDHFVMGAPNGRVFHAGLNYGDEGLELRTLFYLPLASEASNIEKLDTGVLDEVSVQFLPREFRCSACGWDYIGEGGAANLEAKTCANDHTIAEDGVHARLIGLDDFVEISLVARGADNNPKIVGQSESKLAPDKALALAAKGFENPDALVVRASIKEDDAMDTTKLVTDLSDAKSQVAVLTHEKTTLTAQLSEANTALTAANTRATELEGQVATLTQERDAALQRPEASVLTERDEAVAILQDQVNALLVATGKEKLEGDDMPKSPAELKAKIGELTANLTAILPAPGGASQAAGSGSEGNKPLVVSAFKVA